MTKTTDTTYFATHVEEFLADVKAGNDVVVLQGSTPVARLIAVGMVDRPARRTIAKLPALTGRWLGDPVVKSGDLASELFNRS